MTSTSTTPAASSLLQSLLAECATINASDVHLSSGQPPFFRNRGRLIRSDKWQTLTPADLLILADELTDGQTETQIERRGAIDGAVTGNGNTRYRFNIFRRQGDIAIAIRRLEDRIRPLSELGLPDSLYALSELRDGLVVVSGPTGSGKSTTLATLIDRINRERPVHIITIEDPIEYLHPPREALVNQRQLGMDTPTYHDALVSSLRQDPDVILVGEIRELETIRIAITAAETGHLVFTTVHASDAVGVIERITSVFPAEEQAGVRRQLALVLRAVVAQQLIVADGPAVTADENRGTEEVARRVVVSEIMRVTPAVANLIATGKSHQVYSSIESGTAAGMQTRDQDLARLMHKGMISDRSATAYAHNPTAVEERLMRLRSRNGKVRAR